MPSFARGSVSNEVSIDGDRTDDDSHSPWRHQVQGSVERAAVQPERRINGYDCAGLLAAFALMLAVTLVLIHQTGVSLGFPSALRWGVVGTCAVLVPLIVYLAVRDRPGIRGFGARLVNVWRHPSGDWIGFAAGFLVAVPLLGLYSPVLMADADSARVVAAVTHVQKHGIGFLVDTQDNLLPHLILGPMYRIAGLEGIRLFAVVSVMIATGVAGYITRRITSSTSAAAAAGIALAAMQPMMERTVFVPMYPTMLALGYAGGWLAYRAITGRTQRWTIWVGAGACLAAAPEAQAVGLLFLPVPLFMLAFSSNIKRSLKRVTLIYAAVIAVSVPRLVINLSAGGFSSITSYRTDYWITKGYLVDIQKYFWEYDGVGEATGDYLLRLPGRFMYVMGPHGWIFLALALLGLILFCSIRARVFTLLFAGFFICAIIVKQIPAFPRYYSPLVPGIAILIGLVVGGLIRHRDRIARIAATGTIVGLVLLLVFHLSASMRGYDRIRVATDKSPFQALSDIASNGKGVIGARSHGLVNVTAGIPTWGGQFLTEKEYVTYLTWPSDETVIDMMNLHDIGWVLITKKRQLETDYHNTWLSRHYGMTARQIESVAASPKFCLRGDVGGYLLYQLGPCEKA